MARISRSRTRVAWLVTLGVSLLVLAAVPLGMWWSHSHTSPTISTVGDRGVAAGPIASGPEASDDPVTPPLPQADDGPLILIPIPVRVTIPSLSVDAAVMPVGLDDANAVEIPSDIDKVGWYELGVPPGAHRGSAVLVGHRDGRVQGHGVFYDLGLLDVGDRIEVLGESNESVKYRVVARESIVKKRLPYEELFAVDGPPRLTLISCGGLYDGQNGGYQENVVVTAVRVL